MSNRGFIINTHVGQALRNGAVLREKRRLRPKWVLLNEVGRLSARSLARSVFPPHRWSAVVGPRVRVGEVGAGNLIFVRRDWAKKIGEISKLITPGIPGDKWHPVRRLHEGVYKVHGEDTELVIGCDHAWHVKGAPDDGYVVHEANKQIRIFAESSASHVADDREVIRGGDYNRSMDFVSQYMRGNHMRLAIGDWVDGCWRSPGLEITNSWVVDGQKITPGDGHDMLVVEFEFRR